MSAGIVQKLKNEIETQAESQDEVQDFDIESINIGKFTPEIASLFTAYPTLTSLSFTDCGLTTLDGFPKLPNLESLLLEQNKLDGSAFKYIKDNYQNVLCLSLAENNIKTFEDVEVLKSLPNLSQLDLSENPVSKLNGYHKRIFELIKSLKVLDNKDADGQSLSYSDDELEGNSDDEYDAEDDDEEAVDEDESDEESDQKKKKVKK